MACRPRSMRRWIFGFALLVVSAGAGPAAISSPATRCPADLVAAIPPRNASAPTGSQVMARLSAVSVAERSRVLLEEILSGNIPNALRELRAVETSAPGPGGAPVRAVVWVMPDYLAVGSDEDFVRVPLGLPEALAVARRFGFTLPTRKLVNTIHLQAELKVEPKPMTAGKAMASVEYFRLHNGTIERQLRRRPRGTLVSGSKKDVVITPRLAAFPGRVAIYGWLRPDGTPIQPLSTVHGARYADYSHGIRLVSRTVLVDGKARSVFDVLEDPLQAGLLSDEGPDPYARRLLGPDPG